MSEEKVIEYREAVLACHLAARMLAAHDIPKLIEAIERADSFGALLDPTLYRDKHKAMNEDREVLKAALKLRAFATRTGGNGG